MANVNKFKSGQNVVITFKGSREFGNDAHSQAGTFLHFDNEDPVFMIQGLEVSFYRNPSRKMLGL